MGAEVADLKQSPALEIVDATWCGPGKKPVPRNSFIPEIAQICALGLFRADFKRRFLIGETFSEWELVGNTGAGTGHPAIDMVLRRIKSDFRNYYSKTQRNRRLIASGTPASGLREGRSIRADGLGIGIDPARDAIVAELLEVSTIDEAEATIREDIQPKVALLQGPIKKLFEMEVNELRRTRSSTIPRTLIAYGTPWIIPPSLTMVPILAQSAAKNPSTYRWICFGPTYKYRPVPAGPFLTTTEPETSPARGLILYSYHEMESDAVPKEVLERFKRWAERQSVLTPRLDLLPTLLVTQYWKDNNDDLKRLLGFAAIVTLSVAIVVLAVYLAPVVFGAAAATISELTATASFEALISNSPTIVTAISSSMPSVLNFSRMSMIAATSLQP